MGLGSEAALLDGVRVVDLAGEPAAMAGRILADLGAEVTVPEAPGGHPLRAQPHRWAAWSLGKRTVDVSGADDPALAALVAAADVVIDTPGFPGALALDPALAPSAVWVSVTPFGLDGPRAHWRASDLGVMAASGNMYCTGDPDRAPVRCTEPSGYAHVGGETAFAALTGLASGRPQRIDLSMQEVIAVANMATPGRLPQDRVPRHAARREHRPHAGDLADVGRLRLVRPARREGARAEPRDADRARRHAHAQGDGLEHVRAEHGRRRDAHRDRDRRRGLLRPPHDGRALRHRVRDEPHARPDQLPQGDPRQRPARQPRVLRTPARRPPSPRFLCHHPDWAA